MSEPQSVLKFSGMRNNLLEIITGFFKSSHGHQFFLDFLSITGNCAVREYFFCAISEGKRRVFWEGRSWAFFFGLSVTVAEFSVIGSVLADLAGLAGLA